MELEGVVGSPYKHPEVRKKLPAPFERARIDLDGGTHRKRSWKDTWVLDLKPGDMVPDVGQVAEVENIVTTDDLSDVWRAKITNVLGRVIWYPGHQRVYAFTVDDDNPNE